MELGSKPDPQLDIHELFCHYNSLYFDDALGACIVYWSDSRTARSAGMCCCLEGGGCEIRLCKHLLKSRSPTDLKNTLLHEMIHALLFITEKKKDHSYHGPSFAAKAKAINSSSKTDPQRPSGGYNITLSHEFSKEDDSYKVAHWTCTYCGDMIEGTMNREPSANACIENMTYDNSCGNLSYHWHRHKMQCSGRYSKTTDTPRYKDKTRVLKVAQENEGGESKGSSSTTRRSKRKSENGEQTKDLSNLKKSKRVDDAPTGVAKKSLSCNTHQSQKNVGNKQLKVTTLKTDWDPWTTKIPKRPRTAGLKDDHKLSCGDKGNFKKREKKITRADEWFALYGDEKSDEEIKPLVNYRTERRRSAKLLKLKERFPDAEAISVGCSSQHGENIANRKQSQDAPPRKDNIVYILDD